MANTPKITGVGLSRPYGSERVKKQRSYSKQELAQHFLVLNSKIALIM
jgi:hypothetical protein